MRIIHIANEDRPAIKPKNLSKKELEMKSAFRWMEVQSQKNYRAALKEHSQEIERLRIKNKNYMPVKAIKKAE